MARGMALDPSGNVWILGSTNSDPFPQVSPFQSGPPYAYYKAFVTELDAGGGSLRLSSYIEQGVSIAVDANGVAYDWRHERPAEVPVWRLTRAAAGGHRGACLAGRSAASSAGRGRHPVGGQCLQPAQRTCIAGSDHADFGRRDRARAAGGPGFEPDGARCLECWRGRKSYSMARPQH